MGWVYAMCNSRKMMPVMENLRVLTRVRISGAAGVCIGRIEDIRTIDELPEIPDQIMPTEILRDMGVTRIAAVSYFATDHDEVLFFALEIGGAWFDLQRQRIELEVIGQQGLQ